MVVVTSLEQAVNKLDDIIIIVTSRAAQRGGGNGAICPWPTVKGGPKFAKVGPQKV